MPWKESADGINVPLAHFLNHSLKDFQIEHLSFAHLLETDAHFLWAYFIVQSKVSDTQVSYNHANMFRLVSDCLNDFSSILIPHVPSLP